MMTVLVGIALYFGFALFVGRFLSLSTRGELAAALPAARLGSGRPASARKRVEPAPTPGRVEPKAAPETREVGEEVAAR
jgi:hypothetical protein